MSGPIYETCWKCEGSGKLRSNSSDGVSYAFGKVKCDACDGYGELDSCVDFDDDQLGGECD